MYFIVLCYRYCLLDRFPYWLLSNFKRTVLDSDKFLLPNVFVLAIWNIANFLICRPESTFDFPQSVNNAITGEILLQHKLAQNHPLTPFSSHSENMSQGPYTGPTPPYHPLPSPSPLLSTHSIPSCSAGYFCVLCTHQACSTHYSSCSLYLEHSSGHHMVHFLTFYKCPLYHFLRAKLPSNHITEFLSPSHLSVPCLQTLSMFCFSKALSSSNML